MAVRRPGGLLGRERREGLPGSHAPESDHGGSDRQPGVQPAAGHRTRMRSQATLAPEQRVQVEDVSALRQRCVTVFSWRLCVSMVFFFVSRRAFETQMTRMEAEFVQREAPPSYSQLIAQGLIPPVDDFPAYNATQVRHPER